MSKSNASGTKVGYQWFPNDWKQSDTFLDVDDPLIRYYYREVIDLLYLCGNVWQESKVRFEKAQRVTISAKQWIQLKALFDVVENSPGQFLWSHKSVEKRIDRRSVTSAENGEKGGRPPGQQKPKNNLNLEPNQNLSKPKKPNGSYKTNQINTIQAHANELVGRDNGASANPGTLPPDGAGPLVGDDLAKNQKPEKLEALGAGVINYISRRDCEGYADRLDKLLESNPGRDRLIKAVPFFMPAKISGEDQAAINKILAEASDDMLEMFLVDVSQDLKQFRISKMRNAIEFIENYFTP